MQLEVSEAVHDLSQCMDKLSEGDKNFANDLINGPYGFNERGYLSGKQLNCVYMLLNRAESGSKPLPVVEGLTDLHQFFVKTNIKLKYPRITVIVGGLTIQIKLNGSRSKYPGQLTITDGQPYGCNKFYGRVDSKGVWHVFQGKNSIDSLYEVADILKGLNRDPKGFAKSYGEQSGSCCFCNKKLTMERSLENGYGPVCASNWGLG